LRSRKNRQRVVVLVALAMLVQILIPAASGVSFGEGGKDLSTEASFDYEVNLYVGEDKLEDGSIIEIEDLSVLEYSVDFTIEDGFVFEGNEYLELDLSALTGLGELVLPEDQESGRIAFEVGGSSVDAAGYAIDGSILRITFDNGTLLNGINGREGFVSLLFNVEESTSESALVEEIEIEDKETKTFIIWRSNSNATAIVKNGSYKEAEDEVEWIIDVNTELSNLENAQLIDDIPVGLNVEKVEIVDLSVTTENIVEKGAWVEESSYVIQEGQLTLDMGNLTRQAKRFRITMSIDDGISGDVEFTNTATLTSDGMDPKEDSDTVSFNRVTGISKSGELKSDNIIQWTIEFRGDSDEGVSDMEDIFTLPGSVKLVLLEDSVKLNGNEFINDSKDNVVFDVIDKVVFKDIQNSTEAQTLTYETKVIFESTDGSEATIGNNATYNEQSDGANVKVNRGEYVSKDNGRIYGDNNGNTYIDWEIEVNKNNESWRDVEIDETIPDGFVFEKAVMDGSELASTTDGSIVTIEVGAIDEPKTVTVTTRLDGSLDISDIGGVKNQATISYFYNYGWGTIGGGISGGPYTESVEGEFTVNRFNHTISKSSSNLNYKNQTIDWRVDYKTYNNDVDGLIIEDALTGEQQYIPGSFELKLNGTELSLSAPSEGTISFGLDNKSFEISLSELPNDLDSSDTYNHIILTYKTNFDLPSMEDQDTKIKLENNVTINNDGDEISATSNKELQTWISRNGRKTASKESGENRIFNWKVELNPKGKTIENTQTVLDELTGMQKYVDGSIKIYSAELQSNGTLTKLADEVAFSIVYDENTAVIDGGSGQQYDDHTGMEITLNEYLTTPIILEYQTEAVGISEGDYENSISYNGMNYEAKINYSKHDQYITKELLNDRSGNVVKGDILKWKLTINSSLSEIYNFQLKDVMSDGLIFIEDSLVIIPDAGVDDPFVVGGLGGDNAGKEGYKLTKDYVDKEYTIEYETLVFVDSEKPVSEISNDVYISGYSLEESLIDESTFDIVGRSRAGGSGYIDNEFDINIIKVDAATGNEIGREVKFNFITETTIGAETYTSEEELIVRNGEIELTLEENNYNKYYIEELVAPAGYVLNPQRIEITNNESGEIRVENSKILTDITANKIWDGGPSPRPTIGLQLFRNNIPFGEPVELSDGTTEYTWEDLEQYDDDGQEYSFRVDEVEVPENYSKSEEGLTVTNTYTSPKISITGGKTWVGGPNPKPDINLQLYRNGEAYGDPVILRDGETSHTWTDLDKTDKYGVEYKYTVDELNTPEYYGKSVAEDGFAITNTYQSPVTDVTGRKVWVNGELDRPEFIELQLYRRISEGDEEPVGNVVRLNEGVYENTWKGVPINNNAGERYTYNVKEVEVPENYSKSEEGLTVTNTYVIPRTEVIGTKVWIGGPVVKPEIKLQLYRDGEAYGDLVILRDGETSHTWTDLDKTDITGKDHVYSIDEMETPDRFRKEISEDGLTITNRYRRPSRPRPEEPEEPESPEEPEIPVDPETPEVPVEPETPEEPVGPSDPTIPSESGDNTKPETPEEDEIGEGTPGGGTDVDKETATLPKTGDSTNRGIMIVGVVMMTIGFLLRIKQIRRKGGI
jgi:LPXTG-motif cell wall-anchored protein